MGRGVSRRELVRIGMGGLAAASSALLTGDRSLFEAQHPFGISPPDPRTVLGVHTRLTDEVEPWKIERTLDMIRQMGARWIVELFPWAYIEPHQGVFDWDHPDLVVRNAVARGLEVIARLDFVPAWARPAGTTPRLLPRERFPDYANFVAAFAHRYREAVRYFIIWNEPNTSFEWGFRPVSVPSYVELLAAAAASIRAVHPSARILPAGLAPTIDRSDLALEDRLFLQQMYDLGAARYFDALCVHAYGWKFPPDDPPRADRLNFRRVELLREVMEKNGDAAKPVLVTEAGWNDSPRWTKAVRPAQRIAYTLEALRLATASWPWVRALCLWVFRLPTLAHDYNDYFTFVDTNFRPKPIYTAVAAHAGEWVRTAPGSASRLP
ncbi:MAG: beta-galactosidase [Chloroflexi bacterium]|nr:beta-galactosidase [Chloroflexota bacterium]